MVYVLSVGRHPSKIEMRFLMKNLDVQVEKEIPRRSIWYLFRLWGRGKGRPIIAVGHRVTSRKITVLGHI